MLLTGHKTFLGLKSLSSIPDAEFQLTLVGSNFAKMELNLWKIAFRALKYYWKSSFFKFSPTLHEIIRLGIYHGTIHIVLCALEC